MLKNQSLANEILGTIDALIKKSEIMLGYIESKEFDQLEITAKDIINILQSLSPVLNQIKEDIPFISAPISSENAIYSTQNILNLLPTRSQHIFLKIEFELIPILQDFYYDFYFFTCVFGDKEREKKHYAEEFTKMTGNHYIDESMKTGKYKYDISISVIAYNKLEYTKQCIESIIKYTPSYINYELVLVDNGSGDDTFEYFKSLSPTKIFKLKHNWLNAAFGSIPRIYEGKYLLSISNDVIVTENYLDNLIKCIESDPKIAMVVPTTSKVSNSQAIPFWYTTIEEMHEFAKGNNVSNPARWEERTRLCNPLGLYRSDVLLSSNGVGSYDKYFVYSEFCDDALSLRLRRAGHKLILAKDCYCHHFGSITLREAQITSNSLEKSRQLFIARHGVDAWAKDCCFESNLIKSLSINIKDHVNVLGINSHFGSNPIKIKALHKETGAQDVKLFFITDEQEYILDLQPYSERVTYSPDLAIDIFGDITFDYILYENNIKKVFIMPDNFIKLKSKVTSGGILAICASNDNEVEILNTLNPDKKIPGHSYLYWFIWIC